MFDNFSSSAKRLIGYSERRTLDSEGVLGTWLDKRNFDILVCPSRTSSSSSVKLPPSVLFTGFIDGVAW